MKIAPAIVLLAAGAISAGLVLALAPAADDGRERDTVVAMGATRTPAAPPHPGAVGQQQQERSANQLPAPAATDIALTDSGQLIADYALRQLMDSYLAERRNPARLQALGDHLRRGLPAGAAAEAIALSVRYDAYLDAHDALLALQNLGATPDPYRLGGWQQQRRQLRERMLGAALIEPWFGNEEAYLTQALEELGPRGAGMLEPSRGNPDDQARHDQHMRQVLIDAATFVRR